MIIIIIILSNDNDIILFVKLYCTCTVVGIIDRVRYIRDVIFFLRTSIIGEVFLHETIFFLKNETMNHGPLSNFHPDDTASLAIPSRSLDPTLVIVESYMRTWGLALKVAIITRAFTYVIINFISEKSKWNG